MALPGPTEAEYDKFYDPHVYDDYLPIEPSPAEVAYNDAVACFTAVLPQLQAALGPRTEIHEPYPGGGGSGPSVVVESADVSETYLSMHLAPDKNVLLATSEDGVHRHASALEGACLIGVSPAAIKQAMDIAGRGLSSMADNYGTRNWVMPSYFPSREATYAEALDVESRARTRLHSTQGRESADIRQTPDMGTAGR